MFPQSHGAWCVNWPGYEASATRKKIQFQFLKLEEFLSFPKVKIAK